MIGRPQDLPVHVSSLKCMAESAAHYYADVTEHGPGSRSMHKGSIIHAIVFDQPVVVWPKRRQGKAWDAFAEEHDGELIATQTEFDTARRCVDALLRNRHAAPLLVGEREKTIDWTFMGRACSSTPDVVGDTFGTDLKTTATAEPRQLLRTCMRFRYHAQVAFYRLATGRPDWFIVGVEPEAPFDVTVLRVTPRLLDEGEALCREWMTRLIACEVMDQWPGRVDRILDWDGFDPGTIPGEYVEAA